MKVKTNERFKAITGDRVDSDEDKTPIANELLPLLKEGFVSVKGAILFRSLHKLAKSGVSDFPDLTGYECFVNHVHIEDYIRGSRGNSESTLRQGLAFAREIAKQLSSEFPSTVFRVIIASNASGCTVRFHAVRAGEEWLSADLDQYENEAICVLESS